MLVAAGKLSRAGYIDVAKQHCERYGVKKMGITLRKSISASDNLWSALLYDGEVSYFSREYMIHIVNRVGGGDSFTAGLIYALANDYAPQHAIDFQGGIGDRLVKFADELIGWLPVRAALYVGSAVSGLSVGKTAKAMLPFYLIMVGTLFALAFIPGLTRVFGAW